MTCPECGSHDTRVIRTKPYPDERRVWRRRECVDCGARWSTNERPVDLEALEETA